MANNPWRVESARSPEKLQALLNLLDADGYFITFVLTEGPKDGFSVTVIAKQRRNSGNSEAPALTDQDRPRDLVTPPARRRKPRA